MEKGKVKSYLKIAGYAVIGIIVLFIVMQVVIADKYSAQVKVLGDEKKIGVNPTTEKLDFGDLSQDTSANRYITMNAGGVDTFIKIVKFGELSELIKISENNFTMKKGDEKKIEFSVYMPPSAPVGNLMKGSVWIFKIPRIW